jgi:hypothetical protein
MLLAGIYERGDVTEEPAKRDRRMNLGETQTCRRKHLISELRMSPSLGESLACAINPNGFNVGIACICSISLYAISSDFFYLLRFALISQSCVSQTWHAAVGKP